MAEITRRKFLQTMGTGFIALPGLKLVDKLVSPVTPYTTAKDSDWVHFATTCRECPAGCGMVVRHRQGRATKAEGNKMQPIGSGHLCARGQSVLQGHYDPDRLKVAAKVTLGDLQPVPYSSAIAEIGKQLSTGSRRLVIISQLETGALAEIMGNFTAQIGNQSQVVYFEAIDYTALASACEELFGDYVVPHFHLEECDVVIDFGAEILGTWLSPVEFAHQFSKMHAYRPNEAISHFVFAGPTLTQTAANADSFLQVTPTQLQMLALALVAMIGQRGLAKVELGPLAPVVKQLNLAALIQNCGIDAGHVEALASKFVGARSAVAIPCEDHLIAMAAMMLNYMNGGINRSVDFSDPHVLSKIMPHDKLETMSSSFSKNDVIIINNVNPIFVLQNKFALRRAGLVVYLGTMLDETAQQADYLLPIYSPLESWGEYAPYASVNSVMQPATAVLYPHGTMHIGDVLLKIAAAAGKPLQRGRSSAADFLTWMQDHWRESEGYRDSKVGFDEFRRRFLAEGWVPVTSHGVKPGTTADGGHQRLTVRAPSSVLTPHDNPGSPLALWIMPHIMLFDGKIGNRGWLQETPEPMSGVAWGSYAQINPQTARQLGVQHGESVKLATDLGEITTAVYITDGTVANVVTIASGSGHQKFGSLADDIGANAFTLGGIGFRAVKVAVSDKQVDPLIFLYGADDQGDRDLLRWVNIRDLEQGRAILDEITLPLPEGYDAHKDIYNSHPHDKYRWAMVIDLQRCIGCGSCAVACYAENNLAVVGKKSAARRATMAWLRIPHYRSPQQAGRSGFLPMPCQHCDSAPCEAVCPVYAAVHNEEGVNMQVYNRCIGTRYCSNNCPYKVRRFNWSDHSEVKPLDQQLNPDVSVRRRGVMEKCTFCIQRIREGQQRARIQRRKVLDHEIQPACAQTCPTDAITFGNLLDPDSTVAKLIAHDPRRYQLLHSLNTKPAVFYLKRLAESDERI